jgi:hypothetical protein
MATPAPAPAPEATGSVVGGASSMRQITVDALEDMEFVGADEKEIGEIEGVVEGSDGRRFIVIERGGFLGFGAKSIAIPLENVAVQGERLMLRNMDIAALDALPAYKNDGNAFREIKDDMEVGIPQR